MTARVLLIGYGKMGQELVRAMNAHDMQPALLLLKNEPKTPLPCPWTTSLSKLSLDNIDLAIDFSSPEGIVERSLMLLTHKVPLIQGTTGWEDQRELILNEAKKSQGSLVWSNNYSPGLFLFKQIVERAAHLLPSLPDFDVGLIEAHHRKKKDAPSGTLLSLQKTLLDSLKGRRPGSSSKKTPLEPDEVDVATLRLGNIPGYHSLWIDGPSETIELTHSVRSRAVFADGALLAGKLLLETPGVFSFDDLLRKRMLYV